MLNDAISCIPSNFWKAKSLALNGPFPFQKQIEVPSTILESPITNASNIVVTILKYLIMSKKFSKASNNYKLKHSKRKKSQDLLTWENVKAEIHFSPSNSGGVVILFLQVSKIAINPLNIWTVAILVPQVSKFAINPMNFQNIIIFVCQF